MIYLIAPTRVIAEVAATELKLVGSDMRVFTEPHYMDGLAHKIGDIFIVIRAERLVLFGSRLTKWRRCLDMLRIAGIPYIEYTTP
jgi:hypothetical protein